MLRSPRALRTSKPRTRLNADGVASNCWTSTAMSWRSAQATCDLRSSLPRHRGNDDYHPRWQGPSTLDHQTQTAHHASKVDCADGLRKMLGWDKKGETEATDDITELLVMIRRKSGDPNALPDTQSTQPI
jgi:hypothetical protein